MSWYEEAATKADELAEEQAIKSQALSWKPDDEAVTDKIDVPNPLVGLMYDEPEVRAHSKYGGSYVLYVHETDENDEKLFVKARDEDGKETDEDVPKLWEIYAARSVIIRQLQDASPAVGSPIFVRWEGRLQAKNSNRRYHSYVVLAHEPDADLWARLVREKYEADSAAKPDVDDTIATEEDLEKVF